MDRSEAEDFLEDALNEYYEDVTLDEHWVEALLALLEGNYIDRKAALAVIFYALNWKEGDPLRLKLEPEYIVPSMF